MIRNLARCPYCGDCEIALDDNPSLVFNPGGRQEPCPHLAWVDGRYAQWELSPQGINRVIAGVTSAIRLAVASRNFRMTAPPRDVAGSMQGGCVECCSRSATSA